MTIGSFAFQIGLQAGWFNSLTWLAPWAWAASGALWVWWLISHPKIEKEWLRGFHEKVGKFIHPIRLALSLIVFLAIGLIVTALVRKPQAQQAASIEVAEPAEAPAAHRSPKRIQPTTPAPGSLSSSDALGQTLAQVTEALRDVCAQWQSEEHSLQAQKHDAITNDVESLADRTRHANEVEFQIKLLNQKYSGQVAHAAAQANSLRGVLKLRIPKGEEIIEDNTEDETFQQLVDNANAAKEPSLCPSSAMIAAANYLDNLGKRVPKN